MKTQHTTQLDFKTVTLVELIDVAMLEVKAGATTFTCGECISVPTLTVR